LRYVTGMDELATEDNRGGVLVLAAHPNWRESRVNRRLRDAARDVTGVHVQDLYAHYADYDIDVAAEQSLAQAARLIVLLHPVQWYSMPALLKLWIDEVLAYGWAYGPGGTALQGKDLWLVASTGGPESSYHPQGYNRYFFDAFLPPYEQTAALCGLRFLPPLILHGAHAAKDEVLTGHAEVFARRLREHPHWPEIEELDACPACDVPTTDRPGEAQGAR
jgi:glutathione-regulated potassium-efflux system ancillary protein KefF